ncbi:Hypothetical_protein [Hexamita inflata]|uniref:Hypothetical_protein n=1 Tax=Hexamita inflata TaxID=28002 RepID=A0AA86Q094_9EUKA|nr:Hypothetical protein HINF_LOCUS32110 [Hexamita inflata]
MSMFHLNTLSLKISNKTADDAASGFRFLLFQSKCSSYFLRLFTILILVNKHLFCCFNPKNISHDCDSTRSCSEVLSVLFGDYNVCYADSPPSFIMAKCCIFPFADCFLYINNLQ